MTHDQFEFLQPGRLVDDELELALVRTIPADPARGWLPAYDFEMQAHDQKAGGINIRIGYTPDIVMYFGNIGYGVDPDYRGHHYAERACRLLLPLAEAHGMTEVWIMCNPSNAASRRTCERVGAALVEIVSLPEDCDLYRQGDRESCRYRVGLEHYHDA